MANIVDKVKNDLSFENVLTAAMRTPGVNINREKFLKKELMKYCRKETVLEAVKTNPAKAGISRGIINKISRQVINYETTKVTGFSVIASIPGGPAAIGAAAADITSYFVFVLRAVQQLAYLYGFDEFDLNQDSVNAEMMNEILIFMGVMFGVQGAATGLRKIADALAKNIAKNLAKKALTKGTVYPIVKKVAEKIGIQMTKQIFADGVASAVPIAGGVLSGGLTYVMFRPNCMRLRKHLMQYNLSDPEYYKNEFEAVDDESIIDVVINEDEEL